ncbi:MazG nucleotide pyrophosphohydrolase domain-containing protein [Sphaerisporangium sp. B11E5]|uniref:MazG nucleotide pyrophosphohydrolase domain-containing protein n=1 Tax=Sphaerisporangium sp. B11E5 TaxID=3153563 RepID=UPI00325E7C0F
MHPLPSTPLTLGEIQSYVADMEKARGFTDSTILEQTLKLAEETGEVCKAVRKHIALSIDPSSTTGTLGDELADVLIYLAAIANRAGIDLADALREKEKINETRVWT